MSSALDHSNASAILHICGLFPGYNNRHPTCTPWKKRICLVMSVVVILIFDYIIGNLPADRVFENIKRKLI